jgi:hypothetical protein
MSKQLVTIVALLIIIVGVFIVWNNREMFTVPTAEVPASETPVTTEKEVEMPLPEQSRAEDPDITPNKESVTYSYVTLYDDPNCNLTNVKPDQLLAVPQTIKQNDLGLLDYMAGFPQRHIDTIGGTIFMHSECEGPVHGSTRLIAYNVGLGFFKNVGAIGRMYSWYFPTEKRYITASDRDIIVYKLTQTGASSSTIHTLADNETFYKYCEFICEGDMTVSGDTTLTYAVYEIGSEVEEEGYVLNPYLRHEELDITTGKIRVVSE